MFCASRFKADVTALDIDPEVFPYLEVLAELNDVQVKPLVKGFDKLRKKDLEAFDIIVASDVCFWYELVDPLARLAGRALKAGVKRFIVADPGRPTFYEMADACSKKHKVALAEWYALEPERFEGEIVEVTSA